MKISLLNHFGISKSHSRTTNVVHFVLWFFIIGGALLLLFFPRQVGPYHLKFMGGFALLSSLFIFFPYYFYNRTRLKNTYSLNLIRNLEGAITISLVLNAAGSFGLYRTHFGYDSFLHFGVSLLIAILLFGFIYVANRNLTQAFVLSFFITILFGFINEGFEKYGDMIFGTVMFGEDGQPGDTVRDLIYDTGGAFLGSAIGWHYNKHFLKKWLKKRKK